jgi:alkylglycerol monooxygenase
VNSKLIALSIPMFFVLIGLELLVGRLSHRSRYRFEDSITNLACGVGQQVLEVFFKAVSLTGYVFLYEHARVATLPASSWLTWVGVLFGVDLAYYWFHRASHRVNFLWATHVVHHQSEEYNLSVALRQSWFYPVFAWVFYLPLAVLGFSPLVFVTMKTINTLYQFWIHTRAVGTLGPLEWVMNTPSHHRVHHGIDPKYIDRNYAGIFIVWDRLFGTFQREEEEPAYGIVKPLASFNPFWANSHYWLEMVALARSCSRFSDKLLVPFMPPEWRPKELGGNVVIPEVDHAGRVKYDVRSPLGLRMYVAVQFALVGAAVTRYLELAADAPATSLAGWALLLLFALLTWGALFEKKPYALKLEIVRLVLSAGAVPYALRDGGQPMLVLGGVSIATVVFGAWVLRYRSGAAAPDVLAHPAG